MGGLELVGVKGVVEPRRQWGLGVVGSRLVGVWGVEV